MFEIVTRHKAWNEAEQRERALKHLDHARIIVCDTCDVGLLKVVKSPTHAHLSQIQIAPPFQGRGIGTQIISGLQAECSALYLPIILTVYSGNRAIQLYQQLGFEIVEESLHSCEMKWKPAP